MDEQIIANKVFDALNKLGKGTADEIIKDIEEQEPELPNKELIAAVHKILADLFAQGKIAGTDSEGTLIYSL